MKPFIRLACATAVMLSATCTNAQDWPTRQASVINPFSSGTTTDTVARIVVDRLRARLGKTFIVESRPGAGGMIGTSAIAKANPDGNTFGVSIAGPLVLNTVLYKSMTYNPREDLTPLTLGVHQPCLLVANKSLGVSTVQELVSLLKRNPGKFNYGYVGNGSLGHLVMSMLAMKSGTEIVPVLYGGAGQAMLSILSGDVHMACLPASGVVGHVRSGGVTPLAVSTAKRAALLPNVPTLQEQGFPDIVGSAWIGFVAPAKTPKSLADRMSREIGAVLREPEVVEALRKQLMEPAPGTPEEFASFMKEELQRWKPVIQQNKITSD
jgi:tripartite-type tricarboxylate transporter receptor subunit TctC